MTVATMRAVDRFAGIPFCLAVGLYRMLIGAKPSRKPKRILVMKFFGMGSILLSTPFLTALRTQFPDAQLLYLSFASNREILERLPQVSERLTISTNNILNFLRDAFSVLRQIRGIDVVFDLEFFSKFSTLLGSLSGAPVRIGFQLPTRWRRWNLTSAVPLDHSVHVTKAFMRQLAGLGIDVPSTPSIIPLTSRSAERASLYTKTGLGSNGISTVVVNINAGATFLERRWPAGHFVELVRSLSQKLPCHFYFAGSVDERSYVADAIRPLLQQGIPAFNMAGALTIGELIALLERSRLLITNDSGPMHIASSVGTPVIAMFGPESPELYGPTGRATILYKRISCSPCLSMYNAKMFSCPYDAQCMREIEVHEVVQAALALYPYPSELAAGE